MGRGRKGITEQSNRKPKRTVSSNCRGGTLIFVKTEKQKKMPVPEHVVDFVLAAPESLKARAIMLLGVVGEANVSRYPVVNQLRPGTLLGGAQSPLGSSTRSQRINGNRQPPCQRLKVLAEARQTKQPPSTTPIGFCVFA